MSRPTFLILSALSALPSLSAQNVGAGQVTQSLASVSNTAVATAEKATSGATDFVSEAGSIAKDAVSVDTVEVHEGGAVTKTTEILPVAAAGKLSGLLRTRHQLPGGTQVTKQHGVSSVAGLVQPPFSNTTQAGRGTVTEKSYLPFPLPSGVFNSTEQHEGGVTTSGASRLQDLRQFYYTKKRLPGGVESYGPPEFFPDANTFAPITQVTETLPSGGTVTRDRALVGALKNPSRIGFQTSSKQNGVTTTKFHSILPPFGLGMPSLGGGNSGSQTVRNPGSPTAGATVETPITQTATSAVGSFWRQINPLNWGRSIANSTRGALSKGAAAVPSAPSPGKWNPAGSAKSNRGNVIRPGG